MQDFLAAMAAIVGGLMLFITSLFIGNRFVVPRRDRRYLAAASEQVAAREARRQSLLEDLNRSLVDDPESKEPEDGR